MRNAVTELSTHAKKTSRLRSLIFLVSFVFLLSPINQSRIFNNFHLQIKGDICLTFKFAYPVSRGFSRISNYVTDMSNKRLCKRKKPCKTETSSRRVKFAFTVHKLQ